MENNIIGRKHERAILTELYKSKQAEFAVIYGRRRVGKTYLVRELFEGKFTFYHTALSPFELQQEDSMFLYQQQLRVFGESLRQYGDYHSESPKDWIQAFSWLREFLSRQSKRKRMVVFLDELPWMDTPRSGFITAFEHFWNGWGSGCHNLLLVVCGSAASWINDKFLNNTGGMYGRTTRDIHLSPFTLTECKQFFKSRNIVMDHYDMLQCYMIMGGIPYYMSYIEKGMSLAQNIDNLFFSKGGKLQLEYDRLFSSLFVDPEKYKLIVKLLSTKTEGYTRKEISEKTNIPTGGGLTEVLKSLEASDFIIKYIPYGGAKRDARYKLVDFFSCFYQYFVAQHTSTNPTFWQDNLHSPALNSWRGFAFEEVCFVHASKLKDALGISGVQSEITTWRSTLPDDHAQIDMLIDRDDRVINVCEMKYYADDVTIDKSYDAELRRKVQSFIDQNKTKKNIHLTLVTTYGLKQNLYSGKIQKVITMDELF